VFCGLRGHHIKTDSTATNLTSCCTDSPADCGNDYAANIGTDCSPGNTETTPPTNVRSMWEPLLEPLVSEQPSELPSAGMGQSLPGFQTTLYLDDLPYEFQLALLEATSWWDTILISDIMDVTMEENMVRDSSCSGLRLGQVIDDVYICAFMTNIDGVGGYLGYATPEYARLGTPTPVPIIGFIA